MTQKEKKKAMDPNNAKGLKTLAPQTPVRSSLSFHIFYSPEQYLTCMIISLMVLVS